MANPAIRRDLLSFDPNTVYEMVLKYSTGKAISNGNIMFTTMGDEVFFLKPEDARKIHELGLGVNEPFRIMKRVTGSGRNAVTTLIVSRVDEAPQSTDRGIGDLRAGTEVPSRASMGPRSIDGIGQQPGQHLPSDPPAAATAQTKSTTPVTQPSQPQDNSLSRIMASSYIAAIDALLLAEQYAQSKGITFRVNNGEIRSAAHCIYISASRSVVR